jgi:hypothetical protein
MPRHLVLFRKYTQSYGSWAYVPLRLSSHSDILREFFFENRGNTYLLLIALWDDIMLLPENSIWTETCGYRCFAIITFSSNTFLFFECSSVRFWSWIWLSCSVHQCYFSLDYYYRTLILNAIWIWHGISSLIDSYRSMAGWVVVPKLCSGDQRGTRRIEMVHK